MRSLEKAEEWLWLESEIILIPHPPCLAWLARLLLFVCSVMYLCSDCNQGGCCTNNKGPFYIILVVARVLIIIIIIILLLYAQL